MQRLPRSLCAIATLSSPSLDILNGVLNPLLAGFGFDCLVDAPDNEILPSGRKGFEVTRGSFHPQRSDQIGWVRHGCPIEDRDSHAHPIAGFGSCLFSNFCFDADVMSAAPDGE